MNFIEQFKQRCAQIDLGLDLSPQKPRYDLDALLPKKEPSKLKLRRYNIHKRSLPIGIDDVVFYGVSKIEAEWLVTSFLKAKMYQDDARDSKTLMYYDILPVEATPKEHSIYFNEGSALKIILDSGLDKGYDRLSANQI